MRSRAISRDMFRTTLRIASRTQPTLRPSEFGNAGATQATTEMSNLVWRTFVRGCYKLAGLDSPYSSQEYGTNWTRQRRRCLKRDDHTCRVCGTPAEQLDREPAVHHIRPRRQFDGTPREMNDLSNLITLCSECHGRYEGKYTDADPPEFVRRARK